jgi:hypothetical protein
MSPNPEITNVDHRVLATGNNDYLEGLLASGENVVKGQVMGVITVSGEYVATKNSQTASNGEQLARAIAAQAVDATAGALPIKLLVKGNVDASLLVFADGGDDLDTVPLANGNPDNYRIMLRDFGIFAKDYPEHWIQDNQ